MDTASATDIFSTILRKLCKEKSSNSEVARDLGINRQQFARYLNGSSLPRQNTIVKIAEYFDVEVSELFQPTRTHIPSHTDSRAANFAGAVHDLLLNAGIESISSRDLQTGFYVQYKQSFSRPGMVMRQLVHVRFDGKTYRYKRRYSSKFSKYMPGVDTSKSSEGVIAKQSGFLMLFDVDGSLSEMTIAAFRVASMYNNTIKPGLHITTGRPGSSGPKSARVVLEYLSDNSKLLYEARRQGMYHLHDLKDVIRYYIEDPVAESPTTYALRDQ